jgi:hypothetical protein
MFEDDENLFDEEKYFKMFEENNIVEQPIIEETKPENVAPTNKRLSYINRGGSSKSVSIQRI